ncbi:putative manganese transporter [Vibrio hangzhouensis]|uniref:putative manganese transporter n=1 Tax=Vibrio hangzhouensis TaxID=462991 RepID=UPI001C97B347|nr:putative manganese transporter [Vibrio hangzhouensis]
MQFVKKLPLLNGLKLEPFTPRHKRMLLPVVMLTLLVANDTREAAVYALSDAFWAVSCYVAFTLILYHLIARLFSSQNRLVELYHHSPHHQVVFSSLLGALPGCGGAIIVTTQFVTGRVGFGSVVAVLTATMGDAAFVILASKPNVGIGLVLLGVVVGILTGFLVNQLHCADFLRPTSGIQNDLPHRSLNACPCDSSQTASTNQQVAMNLQGQFWKWLIAPALFVSITLSLQIDVNELLRLPEHGIEWLGAILSVVMMCLWACTNEIKAHQKTVAVEHKTSHSHPIQKAAQDTHFVSAWVISAFLAFELLFLFADIDLASALLGYGPYMPLIGMAVGLLPGCGPQILITGLYLTGSVPMSGQIANAISNDGDALFPAIALAPKAAIAATFYSAVPALVVGYGYYWLFEL